MKPGTHSADADLLRDRLDEMYALVDATDADGWQEANPLARYMTVVLHAVVSDPSLHLSRRKREEVRALAARYLSCGWEPPGF